MSNTKEAERRRFEKTLLETIGYFEPIIKGICKKYAQLTGMEPEDLAQEAKCKIVCIMQRNSKPKNKDKLNAFISQSLKNMVIDLIRHNKRTNRVFGHDLKNIYPHVEYIHTPLSILLDGLSLEEKKIVLMYMNGFNQGEIAEALKLSQPSISIKMKEIKKLIRENIS